MWTIIVVYCVLYDAVEGSKQRSLLRAVGYPEGAGGLFCRGEGTREALSSVPGTYPEKNTLKPQALEPIFVQTSRLLHMGSSTWEPRYITLSL